MFQTKYLEGVLGWCEEQMIIIGNPDEGVWEDAHTPLPRGMGDTTVPLLKDHHIVHDLWQSKELNERHFFPSDAKKFLYEGSYFPSKWFELCDIYEKFVNEHYSSIAQKGGLKGGASCRDQKIGVCSEGYGEKVSENMSGLVKEGKHWFQTPEHSERTRRRNQEQYYCDICRKPVKGLGPLALHRRVHFK